MQLSKKAIKDFKRIYRKEFGEEISDQQAREMGSRLVRLFKVIYRPIPDEDHSDSAGKSLDAKNAGPSA